MPEAERTWLVAMWLAVSYIILLVITLFLCSLVILTFRERRRVRLREINQLVPAHPPARPPARLLLPEELGVLRRYVSTYRPEGSSETCTICYEELEASVKVVRLPVCLHVFHLKCIQEWLVIKAICPCCKGDVLSAFGLET